MSWQSLSSDQLCCSSMQWVISILLFGTGACQRNSSNKLAPLRQRHGWPGGCEPAGEWMCSAPAGMLRIAPLFPLIAVSCLWASFCCWCWCFWGVPHYTFGVRWLGVTISPHQYGTVWGAKAQFGLPAKHSAPPRTVLNTQPTCVVSALTGAVPRVTLSFSFAATFGLQEQLNFRAAQTTPTASLDHLALCFQSQYTSQNHTPPNLSLQQLKSAESAALGEGSYGKKEFQSCQIFKQ